MPRRIILGLTVAIALAFLAAGCTGGSGEEPGTAQSAPSRQLTQVNEAAGITIEATWVTPEHLAAMEVEDLTAYSLADYALVHLAFTTHSGDLNRYDLVQLSGLSIGGVEAPAEAWVSLSDDSHHREGVLVFARPAASGPAELVLRDIGGKSQRIFRWDMVGG